MLCHLAEWHSALDLSVKHIPSKTVKSIHVEKMDVTESTTDNYLKVDPE